MITLMKIFFIWLLLFLLLTLLAIVAPKGNPAKYLWRGAKSAFFVCLLLGAFNLFVYMYFRSTAFAQPYYLLLLIPVLIFGALYPFMDRFFRPALNYNMPAAPKLSALARFAKYFCVILNILALTFAVIAFARPRDAAQTDLPPTEGVDIILTLDTSESMKLDDFHPNRLEAAKAAAITFIDKRDSDRIGVAVFSSDAMLQSPLTMDYDALKDFIRDIHIGIVKAKSTAVGDAIITAAGHLEQSQAKSKVIILITDGESNDGMVPPVTAAQAAAAMGIKIYTIAVISQKAQLNFAAGQLMEIAAVTGGKYFRATNNEELDRIYSDINALEKTEFSGLLAFNYTDRYHPFLILSLLLLVLSFAFDKVIFVRVP